ncbi:uncharacterized protein [Parasteatoda tepidariorum]|uniref:uncharacterized protein n=1 Tax=Parasteatoda tepidariorum TaxID=114398 RepID=UPI00077FBBFD|nr:uncharacterized protein LOC107451063 [Parasteatoda tepidariorum]
MELGLFCLIILINVIESTSSFESDELCSVSNNHMECVCDNYQNFTVNTVILEDVNEISITGCDFVIVPFNALTNMELSTLEFLNINHLYIMPYAFVAITYMDFLIFVNISDFHLQANSFTEVNVGTINLRHISSDLIPSNSFEHFSNAKNFVISNCHFEQIQAKSFLLYNISYFEINFSNLGLLENEAILIKNSSTIEIFSNNLNQTNNGSFNLNVVKELSISGCGFNYLEGGTFIGDDIEVFNFDRNRIVTMKPEGLLGLIVNKRVIFENNVIEKIDVNSWGLLSPIAFTRHINVSYCCNFVNCDCTISWLWDVLEPEEYDLYLGNSWCLHDLSKNLSEFTVIYDSNRTCSALVLKSLYEEKSQRSLSSSKANYECHNLKLFNIIAVCLHFLFQKCRNLFTGI